MPGSVAPSPTSGPTQ
uniref:Uncharacterized protein n=1 Tax=Arundo donax TaxID=35708 RepID=A0A0A9AYL7_ARUDO